MARFYFNLVATRTVIEDCEGLLLDSPAAALRHAGLVARELLRNAGPARRCWRLSVCDERGGRVSDVLFASVDDTLGYLDAPSREAIEMLCRRINRLSDVMLETRMILLESRALLARAERRPFLAALNGRALPGIARGAQRCSGVRER